MSFPNDLHSKSYVCIHVFEQTRPILLVDRSNGDWSFLCGGLHPNDAAYYRVVGIGHVLDADPSLASLSDLAPNCEAERKSMDKSWTIKPISHD